MRAYRKYNQVRISFLVDGHETNIQPSFPPKFEVFALDSYGLGPVWSITKLKSHCPSLKAWTTISSIKLQKLLTLDTELNLKLYRMSLNPTGLLCPRKKKKNTELLDSRARGLSVQLLTNKHDFYIKKLNYFHRIQFFFSFYIIFSSECLGSHLTCSSVTSQIMCHFCSL